MEKIKFSEIKKYLLTPGAKFYAEFAGKGLCKTPEDFAVLLETHCGLEKDVVMSFLYDMLPLSDEILEALNVFSYMQKDWIREYCRTYQEKRNDPSYTVIGLEDFIDGNVIIEKRDVEQLEKFTDGLLDSMRSQYGKLKGINETIKILREQLLSLDIFTEAWFNEKREANEYRESLSELAKIVLFQRCLHFEDIISVESDIVNKCQIAHVVSEGGSLNQFAELLHEYIAELNCFVRIMENSALYKNR